MNIQLDLILPPIIVGILIVLIIRVQTSMMDNQVESRLFYELQSKANSCLLVIQQEIRDVKSIIEVTDLMLNYVSVDSDTIQIYRSGQNLTIHRISGVDATVESISHPLQLLNLEYSWSDPANGILRISVETASNEEDEVGTKTQRYRAFAEKEFFLKNLTL